MSRRIEQEDLTASIAEALQFISHQHPPDFVRALRRAHAAEAHAPAKADFPVTVAVDARGTSIHRFAATQPASTGG